MAKIVHRDMKDRIGNLKGQLVIEHPFFGIFLSNTDVYENETIPTAATDGVRIYYNPKFFEKLEDVELKAVFLHEVFHMVYSHCRKKRRGIRSPRKWNVAADYAINWEIDDMDKKQIKLPKMCLLDHKYKTKTVEQIYELLPDNPTEDSFDIHMDMPEDEAQSEAVEDRIVAAYEASKREEGKIPDGIVRAVEEIRKARVPWERIFHKYLGSALAKDDFSWLRPNRRFIGEDLYLPSLLSYKIGVIAIAVDTSGSIGEKELGAFSNEIRKVAGLISEVIVMSCDAAVHSYEVIRDMSNFQSAVKKIKGGGGTSFIPPFEELAKRHVIPEVFVYLTDMYGEFPDKRKIQYPVIWVATTEQKAPFGLTVQMRL